MRFDSAFVFAGKYWGISRPINQSFAILYPNNEEASKMEKLSFKMGAFWTNIQQQYIRRFVIINNMKWIFILPMFLLVWT